jgi:TonB family protein
MIHIPCSKSQDEVMPPASIRYLLLLAIFWFGLARPSVARERYVELDQVKAMAISAARPEYPYAARVRRITGSGVYILHINAKGLVSSVGVRHSSGNRMLDDAAISAFKRWRFKPFGSVALRMPVTWTISQRQRHQETGANRWVF